MSLTQILSELQSDVNNINITSESVLVNNQEESKFKIALIPLDQKVLERINTLHNLITIKKTICHLDKVDSKIAQEVFTMLPDLNLVNQAKITTYPSTINKSVLDNVLNSVTETKPTELTTSLTDISNQIRDNQDQINKVLEWITFYAEICELQSKRLSENKPIIIFNRQSRNLFQEDLANCIYFKDTELDYKKYEGKLNNMFKDLYYDPTFKTFINSIIFAKEESEDTSIPPITLADLCEKIVNLKNRIISDKDFLDNYNEKLIAELNNNSNVITDNSIYLANNFNSVVKIINTYKMLFDILDSKDNFFEKLKRLLEFLD